MSKRLMKIPIRIRHISYLLVLISIIMIMVVLYGKISDAFSNHFSITEINSNSDKAAELVEDVFYGKNLFFAKFSDIEKVLRANFGFNHLTIKKQIPNKLIINIQNIQPAAYLNTHLRYKYFADDGRQAFISSENDINLEELVEIEGEDSALNFHKILRYCGELNVKKLSLIDRRRWNITLKDELLIKLPKENYIDVLLYLPKLLNSDSLNGEIKVIDLRAYPQKIYLSKK